MGQGKKKASILSKSFPFLQRSQVPHSESKAVFWLLFLFLEISTIIQIIIPYFRDNNLQVWDTAGHYFSAIYLHDYLFPFASGWNPYFFMGYPQNYFYPPLYTYLSTLLGFVVGVPLAFKLILAAILLLTPFSFYYFARTLNFSILKSAVMMVAMQALLFAIPSHEAIGGTISSTINVGLVGNALALMLLFFYFGVLKISFDKKRYILASILLAAIILSHSFVAVIAGIFFLAYFLAQGRTKIGLWWAIKHFAVTSGLTAFWIVPFITNVEYARPLQLGYWLAPYIILLLLLAAAYVGLVYYQKKKENVPIALFLLIFLLFLFAGDRFFHLPLHFYRFQLVLYLFIPIIILDFFGERDKLDRLILLAVVAVSLFSIVSVDVHSQGPPPFPLL